MGLKTKRKHELLRLHRKLFGRVLCYLCGNTIKRHPTVEHITPKSKGGTHALFNLALSHKLCNNKRGISGITPVEAPHRVNLYQLRVMLREAADTAEASHD